MDEDIDEDPVEWKKFHTTTREYVVKMHTLYF